MWFCLSAVAEFKKVAFAKTKVWASFLLSSVKLVAVMPVVLLTKVMLQSGNVFNLHVLIVIFIHCFPKDAFTKMKQPSLMQEFPEGPSCDGIRSMMLQSSGLWDSNSSDSNDISYWGSKLFAKSFRGSGIKPHDMFLYLSTRNELPCPFPSLAILDSYINEK